MVSAKAAHDQDTLVERLAAAGSILDLFRVAARHLRRLVPYDTAIWMATDPVTGLPTAPTLTENVVHDDASICTGLWEREFLIEDVNQYSELTRALTPAAALCAATRQRPARSARFRELIGPLGYTDELRGVLRLGTSPWGYLSLFRRRGCFDAREADLTAGLSRPLAQAIRGHAQLRARQHSGDPPEPGLMLFAPDGELIAANDAARAWIDQVRAEFSPRDSIGVRLPTVVLAALVRARAIAEDREHGVARARLRSDVTGQWLVCHASCLRTPDGQLGNTALVIEPAKASEIAPIISAAYQLTPREQQITQLLARGHATAEIAAHLYLSAHTVRGYLKAIFDKVGVSSRGELIATLFAEHYAPTHLDPNNVEAFAG